MNNSDIRELEDRLVNVLNESDVAIDVKRLILQNLYNSAKAQADKVITQEINELINHDKGDEDGQSI